MTTLLLYSLVFSFSIYWVSILEKKELKLNIISFKNCNLYKYFIYISVIPIIISGERYNVGTDFQAYLSIYQDISSKNIVELINLSKYLEPLYVLLNKLSTFISFGSEKGVFYAASSLIFASLYIGILAYRKQTEFSIGLSYLIFFCMFFPLTLNIQRQMIAVMIVFIAYRFLLSNEPIKYIFLVLIASGFHSTALIMLPVFLFNILNKKIVKLFYIIILLSPIIIQLGIPIIQNLELFGKYFERYNLFDFQGISLFRLGELFLLIFPIILNRKTIEETNPEIVKIYPVLFISLPLLIIGGYEPWANRLIYYVMILQVYFHPVVVSSQKRDLNKRVWLLLFLVYYVCYFILKFMIVGNEGIFPYKIGL